MERLGALLVFALLLLLTPALLTADENRNPDSYEVFALPLANPDGGPRSVVLDPAPAGGDASPFGWHDTDGLPGAEHTITRGNNVFAGTDLDADDLPDPGGSPDGGETLDFLFFLDLDDPPDQYRPAAVTNAFYWFNIAHDLLYRHGFDEAAGNFQENNYGRGGLAGDPVLLDIQDGAFTNGASIHTPVDGQSPRVELSVWTLTDPTRDAALSSHVLLYAYAFATAQRLVGGPAEVSCLDAQESGGLLVGWADWVALALTAAAGDAPETARGMAPWILGLPPESAGIRHAPYSTDFAVNDLTYDAVKLLPPPFGAGNVWATMLWQVTWELVAAHGFNPDLYGDWSSGGNNLALRLILDGMKLVDCDPGFVEGRDAIFAADEALTGGANRCFLWRGFAARGLGLSAEQGSSGSVMDGTEAFDLPPDCVESAAPLPATILRLEGAGYPNPFTRETTLAFSLRAESELDVTVHDLQGRRVATLFSGALPAGDHALRWDGLREDGAPASSGVYFLRIDARDGTRSRKIILSR